MLGVDNSTLTGESRPVEPERLVYAGTHVARGTAETVVVGTGKGAEFGPLSRPAHGAEGGPAPPPRHATNGAADRARPAALVGGDAGRDDRDLHGQDGNADRERDDGRAGGVTRSRVVW